MREATRDPEEAMRVAVDALRLCLRGEGEAGTAAYRSIARPGNFQRLPLGLHVHLLREAGRDADADALTALTLRWGGDLAWKALRSAATPAMAASDYEAWIAQGIATPTMINRYAMALTRLGRTADLAALFDPALLLRQVHLGDADAVARALLAREAGLAIGSRKSVKDLREVRHLEQRPEFQPLLDECRAATRAYFADWAASDHVLAGLVPREFSFGAWGMISRGEGYNVRHQHSVGWATGVYYPAGLSRDHGAGELRIGGWRDPVPPGWPDAAIWPEAGLLVLIPSYYVHWTHPLGRPGLRLSIAFDAIPA